MFFFVFYMSYHEVAASQSIFSFKYCMFYDPSKHFEGSKTPKHDVDITTVTNRHETFILVTFRKKPRVPHDDSGIEK